MESVSDQAFGIRPNDRPRTFMTPFPSLPLPDEVIDSAKTEVTDSLEIGVVLP